MSFSLTTPQMRAREKDVTRRLGWADLKAGTNLRAVEKAMGLKKGEKVKSIGEIRVASNIAERLDRMLTDALYGEREVRREGFPHLTPAQFVAMFCEANRCSPDRVVHRIEFTHL